ncbi:NusA-like transcription termination signal-binding factor [Methanolapillus millepedarum]|uniref:Probable transcription termination protein NusA n=1 Tax=Methanolapillus millepedarum TaxID=3028296 RepID=A0AA96V252_9EURY|nr:Transcription termination/antitermination protein NusA [Methanosarcinaceae archaeon Ac7]
MSEIKITFEEMQYIARFEDITSAKVLDCIVESDRIINVIRQGDMGLAIGKGGENINRAKKAIDKPIELVEYSDDPVTFIKNVFGPVIVIKNISITQDGDKKIASVEVAAKDKGLAIGKGGKNISKVKLLVQRHHGIHDVILK